VCTEICGLASFDLGKYACDDGNNNNNDGCSSICTIERGWTCGGGFPVANAVDTCAPICGDGLLRGNEPCDDGNILPKDGCSAACTIETGWRCYEEPSFCYKITIPVISIVFANVGQFALTWNETVIMDPAWKDTKWTVNITGPLTPYNVSWVSLSAKTMQLGTKNLSTWFNYTIDRQTFGNCTENITLTFDTPNSVWNSIYSFESPNTNVSFCPPPRENVSNEYTYYIGLVGMIIGIIIIVIGVLSSMAGYSMMIAWSTLHVIQFVNYLPMMMIYMPSSAVFFC
jgi:cysteine-rich repeat protein